MMTIRLFLAALLTTLSLGAQPAHFTWSTRSSEAYKESLAFRMNSAESILASIEREDPKNLAADLIKSEVLFIRTMVEERPEDRASLYNEFRIIIDRLKELPVSSSRRFSSLGEVYLKRGVVNLQAQNNLSAARDFYWAYRSYEKAYELDSTRIAAQTGWGIVQVVAGAIPDDYQWYANLIGISGDPQLGQRLLRIAANRAIEIGVYSNNFNELDQLHAVFVFSYFSLLGGETNSLNPISTTMVTDQNLPLTLIEVERLLHRGKSDKALSHLSELTQDPEAVRFWYLDYLRGRTMVRLLRPDADLILLNYLEHYPGETYKKSAAMYLSWYYFLNGQKEEFEKYNGRIMEVGTRFSGADKLAEFESRNEPHTDLLKARLAYDSGRYGQADSILSTLDVDKLSNTNNKQEWHYRKARLAQETPDDALAIYHFTKVVELPFDDSNYYLPVSCIKIGEIYIEKREFDKAELWLNKALEYKNYPYVADYQRKAKILLRSL